MPARARRARSHATDRLPSTVFSLYGRGVVTAFAGQAGWRMGAIEDRLAANAAYADTFADRDAPKVPRHALAVLTCMDARLDVPALLGLRPGDAHHLANAGAVATDDVIRSLVISHHELGMAEVMVIGHTDCGMAGLDGAALRASLETETGAVPVTPCAFHGFTDVGAHVRRQVDAIARHPWLAGRVRVAGFVHDVADGRVRPAADA